MEWFKLAYVMVAGFFILKLLLNTAQVIEMQWLGAKHPEKKQSTSLMPIEILPLLVMVILALFINDDAIGFRSWFILLVGGACIPLSWIVPSVIFGFIFHSISKNGKEKE